MQLQMQKRLQNWDPHVDEDTQKCMFAQDGQAGAFATWTTRLWSCDVLQQDLVILGTSCTKRRALVP